MKAVSNYLTMTLAMIFFIFSGNISAQTEFNTKSIEGDLKFKQKREQWYENMHRIEEGMNWKIIDRETRTSKYKIKKHEIEYLLTKNKHDAVLSDTLQNEMIRGVWIEKGSDNLAGRVHTADLDIEAGLIYVASSGGNIWRGTLDGENWTCLNNGIKFNNIKTVKLINMNGKRRIVVASNSPSQVHYSDNEGITWERSLGLEKAMNSGTMKRGVLVFDTQEFYVLTSQYNSDINDLETAIYFSDDGAATFNLVNIFSGNILDKDIWTSRMERSSVFYVSKSEFGFINESGEYEALNEDLSSIFEYGSPTRLFLQASINGDEEIFYIASWISSTRNTYFYYSDDKGKNWDITGSVATGPFMDNSFAISNKKPEYLFYGGVELYVSNNGGFSFEKVNKWAEYYGDIINKLHADIPGVDIFRKPSGNELILISTDGGLYISEDNCKTVRNISLKDLNVSQYYSLYTDRHTGSIYAGSQDQGFQRALIDSGKAVGFEQVISGDYGHLTSSDGGTHLWTEYVTFAMIYKNLSNPNTTISKTWSFEGKNWLWLPPMEADPADPKAAYILGGSDDGGSYVWKLEFDDLRINARKLSYNFKIFHNNVNLSAINISPIFPEYLYVAGNAGQFFLSTDAGETWNQTIGHDGPNQHYFYGSSILPSKKNFGTLYVAGSGYSEDGVMVSHDHGKTFTGITEGLPNTMVYDIDMSEDEKYIFAATQVGAYVYSVEAGIWYDLSSLDSPDQVFWTVEYINETNTARFGTYGRGIWDFKVLDYYTDVPKDHAINDDVHISIMPNPVRESSVISINSLMLNDCTVKIYDIEGRVVSCLYEGIINNSIELNWDRKNDENIVVPAGVYMLTVSANGNTWYEKLILE
jgi:photosystem II stability/assembly factor-like uncharacterized protein